MGAGLAVLLIALAAASAVAADPQRGTGAERIDGARSQAAFTARLRWLQKIEGRFGRFGGRVSALADGRRQVEVEVDVGSLEMDRHRRMTGWALSEEFFDAARHPAIVFVSAPFASDLARHGGALAGELSLRGTTRRVEFALLPADCERAGVDCAIRVRGQVRRSDFGMDAHRLSLQDRVQLEFDVWLAPEER